MLILKRRNLRLIKIIKEKDLIIDKTKMIEIEEIKEIKEIIIKIRIKESNGEIKINKDKMQINKYYN